MHQGTDPLPARCVYWCASGRDVRGISVLCLYIVYLRICASVHLCLSVCLCAYTRLQYEAEDRPTTSMLLKHPYIQRACDVKEVIPLVKIAKANAEKQFY